jgi:hypothetical protein
MNIKTCRLCQNLDDGCKQWCASQRKEISEVMPYEQCGFKGTWEQPRQGVVENRLYAERVLVQGR